MQRGRFGHRPRNDPRYYGGEYPFIQTGNIVKASESNKRIEYFQTLNELGLSTSRLFNEKILVITIAANIGYTAILDYKACFPDSLVALNTKSSDISLAYLNVYIRFIRNYIEKLAPQAAQKNINLKQLSKLPIIVPDENIQKKIVEIMERAYSEKIVKEKAAKALLDSIDDYLLDVLGIPMPENEEDSIKNHTFYIESSNIVGGRFDAYYYKPNFQENIKTIKSGKYKCVRLSSMANNGIIKGKLPGESQRSGNCKILQIGSINKEGFIDLDNLLTSDNIFSEKQKLINGDIIIVATGATIGKIALWDKKDTVYLGGDLFKVNLGNCDYGIVISALLRTKPYQLQINRCITGATNGHLSQSDIGNLLIPQIEDTNIITSIADYIKQKLINVVSLRAESEDTILKAKTKVQNILLGGEMI